MGSSMSSAKRLYWHTSRSTATSFHDARQPLLSGAVHETQTVFHEILDPEGNITYGEARARHHEDSCSAKETTGKITLFRRLLRGSGVDVFVGPERVQFSVPKNLLFHYSRVVQRTFVDHGGGKHFKEFEENALYLPEHAPETFDFILKWIYQKELGVTDYCTTLFGTHSKSNAGLEAAFLLLCRMYILADYLDIKEVVDAVMDEINVSLVSEEDWTFSPIGPEVVKAVFQNTAESSRLQKFVLQNLAEHLVYTIGGRAVEEYTKCFTEIEGFGAALLKRVLELHMQSQSRPGW